MHTFTRAVQYTKLVYVASSVRSEAGVRYPWISLARTKKRVITYRCNVLYRVTARILLAVGAD